MRYNVITASHMEDISLGVANWPSMVTQGLISLVNVKLTEGWRPQGGIQRTLDEDGDPLFLQAIVLKTCECDPLPCPEPDLERH